MISKLIFFILLISGIIAMILIASLFGLFKTENTNENENKNQNINEMIAELKSNNTNSDINLVIIYNNNSSYPTILK